MQKIIMTMILCILLLGLRANASLIAGETIKYQPHGFIDFNTYYDTRNFEVHTMNARLDLPGPFSYFGFTNWSGDQTGDSAFNYSNHYTEQTLYYDQILGKPFDFALQYADSSGSNNDLG